MGTLGLVHWDRHAQQTNRPASYDAADEDHGQVLGSGLQDGTDKCNQGPNQDGFPAAEPVHRQTAHQGTEDGAPRKCAVDSSDNGASGTGVEELEEVVGCNDIGHDTGVIAKEK